MLLTVLLATACSSGGGGSGSNASPGSTAPATKGADPGSQSAGDPQSAGYTPTGALLADSGFRPDANGFHFENYGAQLSSGATVTNLTPDDVHRLFGDGVCADAQSGKCDLIPEAQAWMDQANAGTSGGHCEGFSIAALLLWSGKVKADPFGAASTPALSIDGNTALQREIAYDFNFQALPSVLAAQVKGTPNDILQALRDALKPNPSEVYTVGIYKADHTGGHAVTPYAIEDKGNGVENLLIYDNNFPGVTREITFDTTANKWSYVASTNPNEPSSQYIGDATTGTIELDPGFPGLGTQPCPFCGKVPNPSGGSAAPAAGTRAATSGAVLAALHQQAAPAATEQIWLSGSDTDHGHLLITDPQGHQLGYLNGKLVSQIPGGQAQFSKSDQDWKTTAEPDYYVPEGVKYTISLDGTQLQSTDDTSIGVIASSFETQVDNISLNPGEKDTFVVAPDATQLSYTSSRSESPTISVGVSDTNADYTFEVMGVSDQPGSTVNVMLPADGTDLTVDTAGQGGTSDVSLQMTREDGQGVQVFKHSGISLAGGDQATLKFGDWANGQPLPLVVTHAGNQTTQNLTDEG
jgi:hypothetical protein